LPDRNEKKEIVFTVILDAYVDSTPTTDIRPWRFPNTSVVVTRNIRIKDLCLDLRPEPLHNIIYYKEINAFMDYLSDPPDSAFIL
jgi:hypothetical protein